MPTTRSAPAVTGPVVCPSALKTDEAHDSRPVLRAHDLLELRDHADRGGLLGIEQQWLMVLVGGRERDLRARPAVVSSLSLARELPEEKVTALERGEEGSGVPQEQAACLEASGWRGAEEAPRASGDSRFHGHPLNAGDEHVGLESRSTRPGDPVLLPVLCQYSIVGETPLLGRLRRGKQRRVV